MRKIFHSIQHNRLFRDRLIGADGPTDETVDLETQHRMKLWMTAARNSTELLTILLADYGNYLTY